jgi:hypothetical protein
MARTAVKRQMLTRANAAEEQEDGFLLIFSFPLFKILSLSCLLFFANFSNR